MNASEDTLQTTTQLPDEEIEAIADELQMSPDDVRDALGEQAETSLEHPDTASFTSRARLEDIDVQALRDALADKVDGRVSVRESRERVSMRAGCGRLRLLVRRRDDDRVSVRLRQRHRNLARRLFGGLVGGVGGGLGGGLACQVSGHFGALGATIWVIGIVMMSGLAALAGFWKIREHRRASFEQLACELKALIDGQGALGTTQSDGTERIPRFRR